MHSDPISDFLTKIRNACRAGHRYVDLSWSAALEAVAGVLKEGNYVEHILVKKDTPIPKMRVFLKYGLNRTSVIKEIKRVSKPGRRHYVGAKQIPHVRSGLGLSVISTSKGMMSGKKALEENVGGEVICYVW